MNLPQVFQFDNQDVRTIEKDDGPWFVAADVCGILNLSNPSAALSTLEDDERSKFNLGRQGEANIVNESGLYSLIMSSRKPEAKRFKKWVTSEVLPAIRKTGNYGAAPTNPAQINISSTRYIELLETENRELRLKRADRAIQDRNSSTPTPSTPPVHNLTSITKKIHATGTTSKAWADNHGFDPDAVRLVSWGLSKNPAIVDALVADGFIETTLKPEAAPEKFHGVLLQRFMKLYGGKTTVKQWHTQMQIPYSLETVCAASYRDKKISGATFAVLARSLGFNEDEIAAILTSNGYHKGLSEMMN